MPQPDTLELVFEVEGLSHSELDSVSAQKGQVVQHLKAALAEIAKAGVTPDDVTIKIRAGKVEDVPIADAVGGLFSFHLRSKARQQKTKVPDLFSPRGIIVDVTIAVNGSDIKNEAQDNLCGDGETELERAIRMEATDVAEDVQQVPEDEVAVKVISVNGNLSYPGHPACPDVPTPCNPACIKGRGRCWEGTCYCRIPYYGETCEKKFPPKGMITIGVAILLIILAMLIGAALARAIFPILQNCLHHTHGQYPVQRPPRPPRKPAAYGPAALLQNLGGKGRD